MRRALVTGGAGFVGRNFVRQLISDGVIVDAFDIDPQNMPKRLVWQQDARDFFRTDDTRYDLVVHCAAVVGGRATIEGAPLKVAVDLAIDAELFQWALRTRPAHLVYYSSSAAYPIGLQNGAGARRLHEDDLDLRAVREPDASYGWVKLTGEKLAAWAQAEGLRVHVFRPFSGYGEDQSTDYPFPAFIARAQAREDPFTVWGDGRQCRDWIHVDDVIGATLAAVEADLTGPFNLSSGHGTSMDALAGLVCEQAGYCPALRHEADKPAGVRYRVGVPERMRSFYLPAVSLEEGIARALSVRVPA